MKNIFAVIFIVFVLNVATKAQEDETWKCATDEIYNELLKNNPNLLVERNKLNDFIKDFIKNNPKTDDIYVIPVVFHVVHNYGEENISYEQILGAIEFMNKDYRLQRADTNLIIAPFKNIAADTRIEFRLAKIDPWGECTIGVTKTVSETTNGGGEEAKEAAPSWPSDKYLNIWTVKALGYGAAGWSYYPGTASQGYDGIILLHNYIGYNGTSSISHASVVTHEAGHYLNLAHPWGSTNDPGLQSNCDMDDGIDDTPNTIGHTDCNLSAFTCGSLDNVQNFMEYSYCYKMFTAGQKDVMRATLNSSVSGRNNLWSASNRIATGTNDGYVAQICAPIADFSSGHNLGCTGFTVNYNNLSYNTDFIGSFNWTFEGGYPTSSDLSNPIVNYNDKGLFDVQLYVENPTDSNVKQVTDYIRVYDIEDGYSLPYTESFETSSFPWITGNSNNDFYIVEEGVDHWTQTSVGYSGKGIKIVNRNNDAGDKNRIYLPNVLLEDFDNPVQVKFKAAYGRTDELKSDRLKFYVSSTCGDSARIVYVLTGTALTSTYVNSWSTYIPTASHWKTHTFTINPTALSSNNLRLIIESESNGGNAIYIDEVSFETILLDVNTASVNNKIEVYPNPCNDELYIQNSSSSQDLNISISDYTGRIIYSMTSSGLQINASQIVENLPTGIYFLKIDDGVLPVTSKLVKE